jgi:hypothetical protein
MASVWVREFPWQMRKASQTDPFMPVKSRITGFLAFLSAIAFTAASISISRGPFFFFLGGMKEFLWYKINQINGLFQKLGLRA